MDPSNDSPNSGATCGACGEVERQGDPAHRRGRCRRCYEAWIRERPVGMNAFCNACGERRHDALRHYEMRRTWVVLCHNCAARAEQLSPQPYSVTGLRLRLSRDRRWGDRRAESVGSAVPLSTRNRREGDRRTSDRNLFDATEFAELVLELEAEFADAHEDQDPADGPITGVHKLAEPGSL